MDLNLTILTRLAICIVGAIVGSFLNVCIYRMPRGKSVVFPRSQCVHCGARIKWHENIPLVSYVLLRARCSSCKKPISFRYFTVELLTAVLFLLFYAKFGLTVDLLFYLILVCGLIIATFIDFEYQLIPDTVSFGGLAIGLAAGAVRTVGAPFMAPVDTTGLINQTPTTNTGTTLPDALLGALIGALSIYSIGAIGKIVFRKKLKEINEDSAMGFGDVKFLGMIGAFLGWQKTLLVFFMAPFFGAAAGIILKIKNKAEIIPYGPYLSLATVITTLWGEEIIAKLFYF